MERDVRLYVEPLLGQASPQTLWEWVCASAAEGGLRAGTRFGAGTFGLGARAGRLQLSVWRLIFGGEGRKALCRALARTGEPAAQWEWVCARAAEGGLRAGMRFGAGTFGLGARAGRSHFPVWTLIFGGEGRKALCRALARTGEPAAPMGVGVCEGR